jgi:hypothetical protein
LKNLRKKVGRVILCRTQDESRQSFRDFVGPLIYKNGFSTVHTLSMCRRLNLHPFSQQQYSVAGGRKDESALGKKWITRGLEDFSYFCARGDSK